MRRPIRCQRGTVRPVPQQRFEEFHEVHSPPPPFDLTEIDLLADVTGRLNTLCRAGVCNNTTLKGLYIDGVDYEAPDSHCTYSFCSKCGITKYLDSVLTNEKKAYIVLNLLENTKSTTLIFPRFENVRTETKDGHYDSTQEVAKFITFGESATRVLLRSLSELKLRQELFNVVKEDVMDLISHLNRDSFHKRSWRRLDLHRPPTVATAIVDWASAIPLGGLADITCASRPFVYNEVFVVSIKGPLLCDGDAIHQVYYNEVFSFITESTGINKDNDHKAHEVHLAVVAKDVKE